MYATSYVVLMLVRNKQEDSLRRGSLTHLLHPIVRHMEISESMMISTLCLNIFGSRGKHKIK